MEQISLRIESHTFTIVMHDTPAARALAEALPLKVRMARWGEEYYGDCGVTIEADESARELMEIGEIAYWPPGQALCVFFGPTPASTDARPRAASPVVPLGQITSDVSALKALGASVAAEFS